MNKKTILIDYTIPGIYNAGIRNHTDSVIDTLIELGIYNIIIVTPIKLHFKNVEYLHVDYPKRIPGIHRLFYYKFRFAKAIRKLENIDLLYSAYFQLPKGVLQHFKCAISIHDMLYFDLKDHYRGFLNKAYITYYNYILKINYRYCNQVLTLTNYSLEWIKENLKHLPNKPIKLLAPTIKIPVLKDKYTKDKIIVYFGGWENRKNGKYAVEGAIEFLKENPDFKLICSGLTVEQLNEIIRIPDNFKEKIIVKERFSLTEIHDFLKKARASLYVSSYEGFGMPIIEAQLYQTPVVMLEIGVLNDLPRAGVIIIENLKSTTIASGIEMAINISREKQIKMQAACKEFVIETKNNNIKTLKGLL